MRFIPQPTSSEGVFSHDIYKRIEEIDKELEKEYEDGETAWASNLECEKEELEEKITELEAE